MKKIPHLLLVSRLVLSFVLPIFSFVENGVYWIAVLIFIGLLTDIFDGIIARQIGVSTPKLRLMDSWIDRVFWISILATAYLCFPEVITQIFPWLVILISLDGLYYLVSLVRFKKAASAHPYITKLLGISLFVGFELLFIWEYAFVLAVIVPVLGVIARIDSILIYLILKEWDCDIPSFVHAIKLRKGKPIRRTKLLN